MKYSIEGSTLTDIANAIREQYGEDSAIAVSDMAEAILGISGDSESGIILPERILSGTFQISSDSINITIPHNANSPKLVLFMADEAGSSATVRGSLIGGLVTSSAAVSFAMTSADASTLAVNTNGFKTVTRNPSSTALSINNSNYTFVAKAGLTYRWFAYT